MKQKTLQDNACEIHTHTDKIKPEQNETEDEGYIIIKFYLLPLSFRVFYGLSLLFHSVSSLVSSCLLKLIPKDILCVCVPLLQQISPFFLIRVVVVIVRWSCAVRKLPF